MLISSCDKTSNKWDPFDISWQGTPKWCPDKITLSYLTDIWVTLLACCKTHVYPATETEFKIIYNGCRKFISELKRNAADKNVVELVFVFRIYNPKEYHDTYALIAHYHQKSFEKGKLKQTCLGPTVCLTSYVSNIFSTLPPPFQKNKCRLYIMQFLMERKLLLLHSQCWWRNPSRCAIVFRHQEVSKPLAVIEQK